MTIWDVLTTLKDDIVYLLDTTSDETKDNDIEKFNNPGWINKTWINGKFRRAHLSVVDARETKGVWMLHFCVFPHLSNTGPIFGLDFIAGKNKVTGFFHDFSPTVDSDHPMIQMFGDHVSDFNMSKERELPDWAKSIFSKYIIAAGNVTSIEELENLSKLSFESLKSYLENIRTSDNTCDISDGQVAQNRYAAFQKQNPHTPRTMKSLGLNEQDVDEFIQSCLFPDV